MGAQRKIFIAFILNLLFSIFEFAGGIFTGSVAIISDAVHDVGDAASIGVSYFLEKKSKRQPDSEYTYGYLRYSVVGSITTTLILLIGSVFVIFNAVDRIFNPCEINYDGMILFAIVGVVVNFMAAFLTGGGESLNQKAVNLHMLEDLLGWLVVLAGAVIMRFTSFALLDPILSVLVAVFILFNAIKNIKEILNILLEKVPTDMNLEEIKEHLCEIDGVLDVHHIHLWSMDGQRNFATMHIVTNDAPQYIKRLVRQELFEHNISHVTLELEKVGDECESKECHIEFKDKVGHCCHHHH